MSGTLFSEECFKENNKGTPCLLYLHSHSGCQVEASDLVRPALEHGFALCTFDFAGYGRSEGEYGTLGLRETQDVQAVIDHLTAKHKFRYFYIWGRSMGAATAIHFSAGMPMSQIRGLVLDSPFSDAKTMVKDVLAESGIPRLVTSVCLMPLASTIKDKTGFDVLENSPLEIANKIQIPSLVLVADKDIITKPERVKEIFSALQCSSF